MLAWCSQAIFLASDSADGTGSDIEERMKDLDLHIQQERSSTVGKEDDEQTVQHMYFSEDTVTEKEQEGSSVDIPDDISESTCASVCKALPSGHIMQVTKQPIPIGDGTESLFSIPDNNKMTCQNYYLYTRVTSNRHVKEYSLRT